MADPAGAGIRDDARVEARAGGRSGHAWTRRAAVARLHVVGRAAEPAGLGRRQSPRGAGSRVVALERDLQPGQRLCRVDLERADQPKHHRDRSRAGHGRGSIDLGVGNQRSPRAVGHLVSPQFHPRQARRVAQAVPRQPQYLRRLLGQTRSRGGKAAHRAGAAVRPPRVADRMGGGQHRRDGRGAAV